MKQAPISYGTNSSLSLLNTKVPINILSIRVLINFLSLSPQRCRHLSCIYSAFSSRKVDVQNCSRLCLLYHPHHLHKWSIHLIWDVHSLVKLTKNKIRIDVGKLVGRYVQPQVQLEWNYEREREREREREICICELKMHRTGECKNKRLVWNWNGRKCLSLSLSLSRVNKSSRINISLGQEPWSSGYGRRPKVMGSNPGAVYWMVITFFTCCKNCNVCLKRRK